LNLKCDILVLKLIFFEWVNLYHYAEAGEFREAETLRQPEGIVAEAAATAGSYHLLTIDHVFKPHLSCLMYLLSLKRPR
jgi:hypothetical protein